MFVNLKEIGSLEDCRSKVLVYVYEDQALENTAKYEPIDVLIASIRKINYSCTLILDNIDEIIVDGANAKSKFLDDIKMLLKESSYLNVLTTSREETRFLENDGFKTLSLRLGPLDDSDSRQLLRVLVKDIQPLECAQLCKICGNSPLALKMIAMTINEDDVNSVGLVEDLYHGRMSIFDVLDKEELPDHMRVYKILDFTYSNLKCHEREMYVSLSLFHSSFDARAVAKVVNIETTTLVKQQMGVLVRKSLVEYDSETKRYSLHTLIQDHAEKKIQDSKEMKDLLLRASYRFNKHFLLEIEQLNQAFLSGNSVFAMQSFGKDKENFLKSLNKSVGTDELHTKAVNIMTKMDIFMDTIFWNDKGKRDSLYDTYLSETEERDDIDTELYSELLVSKAFGVLHFDEDEASNLLSEATEGQEHGSSPEHRGKCLCYQGFRSMFLEETEEGSIYLENGIEALEKLENSDLHLSNKVVVVLSCRILCEYYRRRGKKQDAAKTIAKVIATCKNDEYLKSVLFPKTKEVLSFDTAEETIYQPISAQISYFLSKTLKTLGGMEYVKSDVEQALEIICELRSLIGDTLDVAQLYYVHGITLSQMGCYREGIEVLKTSLLVRNKTCRESAHHGETYHQLGWSYYQQENYETALELHKKALVVKKNLFGEQHLKAADTYHELGNTCYKLARYDTALGYNRKALAVRKACEDEKAIAESQFAIGCTLFKLKHYKQALKANNSSFIVREQLLGKHVKTADSIHSIGCTVFQLKNYFYAIKAFKESATMRKSLLGNHVGTADSYYKLGCTYYEMKKYVEALDAHKEARLIREELQEYEKTLKSLYWIGKTHQKMKENENAKNVFAEAVLITKKFEGQQKTADVLNKIGHSCFEMKYYKEAVDVYKIAVNIGEKLQEHEKTFESLYWIGKAHHELQDFESEIVVFMQAFIEKFEAHKATKATKVSNTYFLTYYGEEGKTRARDSDEKALEITEKLDKYIARTDMGENIELTNYENKEKVQKYEQMSDYFNNVGHIYCQTEDYARALEAYTRALHIREELQQYEKISDSWDAIGCAYYEMKDYKRAMDAHTNALLIRKELQKLEKLSDSWNNIGCTNYKIKDYKRAIDAHMEALKIRENLQKQEKVSDSLNDIGRAYYKMEGDYKTSALNAHMKALEIREALQKQGKMSDSLNDVGRTYCEMKDFGKSRDFLQKAFEIRSKLQEYEKISDSFNDFGCLFYEMADYAKALDNFSKALQVREELEKHEKISDSLDNIGRTHIRMGNHEKALNSFMRALKIREKHRRLNVWAHT